MPRARTGSSASAAGAAAHRWPNSIAVFGSLRQERWEKDGQKRSKVVIHARDVQFIGKAESGTTMEQARCIAVAAGLVQDAPATEPDDDDIPF